MQATVKISDDFDPGKIAASGQCFRAREIGGGMFRFVSGEHVLYIKRKICADAVKETSGKAGNEYEISCSAEEWNKIWVPYFDLGRNYERIRLAIPENDAFLRDAAERGRGIRILLQDKWETLCSFIISQRKSIPAIKTCVEKICEMYGTKLRTPYEALHLFPSQEQILGDGADKLCGCSLGYRLPYVREAAQRTAGAGDIDINALESLGTDELISRLMEIRGVGIKVASCVALFAYGRTECAPIDVWIQRVIDEHYAGAGPFEQFGDAVGIMQQYMYFAATRQGD